MRTLSMLVLVLAVGCGGGSSSEGEGSSETTGGDTAGETGNEPVASLPGESDRPVLTAEECAAQNGSVVGDIGDGAIHRPDYVCPSGQPPLGNVASGIEGSVCCS